MSYIRDPGRRGAAAGQSAAPQGRRREAEEEATLTDLLLPRRERERERE